MTHDLDTQTPPAPGPVGDRHAAADSGHPPRLGRLATAMVVDAFGSGLFGPFGLLYAHAVVGLPLGTAGVALAIVGMIALALGPVAGVLVDRFGAARVAATGNAVAALGAATLLFARDLTVFVIGAFLSTVAIRVFWAAFAPLVGDAVPPGQREKWFGLLRGSRYAGTAAGGLLASAVLLLGQHQGLLTMVAVDGASYLLAAALIAGARIAPRGHRTAPDAPAPSYRAALRDRTSLALIGLNVLATLLISAPAIAMPIFVLSVLHQPAWLPGALAGTGTVALAIGVTLVHRVTAGRGRLRVLAGAGLVWTIGALAYALTPIVHADLILALLFLAVVAIGLGEALHGPTADTLPLVLAPPGMAGRYTALHQVAWGISGSLTPALVGTLMSGNPAMLWLVLAAIGAATAAIYRFLPAAAHHRASTVGSTGNASAPPAPAGRCPRPAAGADVSPAAGADVSPAPHTRPAEHGRTHAAGHPVGACRSH